MSRYFSYLERLFAASSSVKMHRHLEHIERLDHLLGNPSKSFRSIHIAGSNGKGSVATKIAYALDAAGYRIGLYTSPHLYSFRERISCGKEWISEEVVVEGLAQVFAAADELGLQASFFELTTMLAFITFRAQKIDIAVIETGLGGRLDATNIISPLCTVITSISREHTQLLGNDLESIASEKAGIIKENVPVILGPKARFQAIYDRAKLLNAPIYLSKNISHFFDEENSATAQLALEHLPFTLPREAIETGLRARPPCRFEKADDVLFDVAHNPDGFFHLLQALHTFYPKREMRFVVGFSADKDYAQCLELISSVATHIHLVQASTPRAAPLDLLESAMEAIKKPLHTLHPSVMGGVQEAYVLAQDRAELLVIAGSFYLMADAKQALGFYAPRDPMDLNEKMLSESFASSKLT